MSDATPDVPPVEGEQEQSREAPGEGERPGSGQAFLAKVLQNLPYPVSYVDADLVYRECNAAAAATVRCAPDEIIGKSVASVVGDDSEILALLRQVLETGEPYSGTVEFTAPDSTRAAHYRVSYVPDVDAEGRTVGVLTDVVDVTDLIESERRFRTLVESMTEGVALHELVHEGGQAVDYRILEVNSAFEVQTGISADAAAESLASELYGTGEAPFLAEFAQVAEGGRPISFETYFAPMGRHFRVAAVCPAPGRFATIFEDISDRKGADEERERLLDETRRQAEKLQTQSKRLQAQTRELRERSAALAEQVRLTEQMNRIDRLVLSTQDAEEIMQVALGAAVRALAVDGGAVELRGPSSDWVVHHLVGFDADEKGLRLAKADAPIALLVHEFLEPVRVADTRGSELDVGFVHRHGLRSVLAVPLLTAETMLGCMLFFTRTVRHFSEIELDFVRKVGATVSLAIEKARLLADEQVRTRRAAALRDIAETGSASLSVRDATEHLVAATAELLTADRVILFLADAEGRLWPAASIGYSEESLATTRPVPEGTEAMRVYESAEPLFTEDTAVASKTGEAQPAASASTGTSGATFALDSAGGAFGVLSLSWPEPRRFEDAERVFLSALAAEVAVTLQNARLSEAEAEARREAKEELARMRLLREIILAASAGGDAGTMVKRVIDAIGEYGDLRGADVRIFDEHTERLTLLASVGLPETTLERIHDLDIAGSDHLSRQAARARAVLTHEDDEPTPERQRVLREAGLPETRYLVAPLDSGDRLLGTYSLVFDGRRPFEQSEKDLFRAMGRVLAQAIENARLVESRGRGTD